MPAAKFRNEQQLQAVLDRLEIDKDSEDSVTFATGWQHRERGRAMQPPGWYEGKQKDFYCAGWEAAQAAGISGYVQQKPADPRQTLPPFPRFELAKASLQGFRASGRSLGADEAIACWSDADAVLAAMDDKDGSEPA